MREAFSRQKRRLQLRRNDHFQPSTSAASSTKRKNLQKVSDNPRIELEPVKEPSSISPQNALRSDKV